MSAWLEGGFRAGGALRCTFLAGCVALMSMMSMLCMLGPADVVVLTDKSFRKKVLKSKATWLVEVRCGVWVCKLGALSNAGHAERWSLMCIAWLLSTAAACSDWPLA